MMVMRNHRQKWNFFFKRLHTARFSGLIFQLLNPEGKSPVKKFTGSAVESIGGERSRLSSDGRFMLCEFLHIDSYGSNQESQ
ncbi:hypothetical protein Bca101_048305 [Brassica carinata]